MKGEMDTKTHANRAMNLQSWLGWFMPIMWGIGTRFESKSAKFKEAAREN